MHFWEKHKSQPSQIQPLKLDQGNLGISPVFFEALSSFSLGLEPPTYAGYPNSCCWFFFQCLHLPTFQPANFTSNKAKIINIIMQLTAGEWLCEKSTPHCCQFFFFFAEFSREMKKYYCSVYGREAHLLFHLHQGSWIWDYTILDLSLHGQLLEIKDQIQHCNWLCLCSGKLSLYLFYLFIILF